MSERERERVRVRERGESERVIGTARTHARKCANAQSIEYLKGSIKI